MACQSGEVAGILQSPILSRRLRGTLTPVGEPRASRETKPHRGIQQDQGQEEFKREKAVETVGPQIPQRPPRQLRDGSRCSEKHSDSHHHCARSLWMVPDGIKVTSFAPASPQYSRTLPFDRENPTDAQRRYCTSHCSGQPQHQDGRTGCTFQESSLLEYPRLTPKGRVGPAGHRNRRRERITLP